MALLPPRGPRRWPQCVSGLRAAGGPSAGVRVSSGGSLPVHHHLPPGSSRRLLPSPHPSAAVILFGGVQAGSVKPQVPPPPSSCQNSAPPSHLGRVRRGPPSPRLLPRLRPRLCREPLARRLPAAGAGVSALSAHARLPPFSGSCWNAQPARGLAPRQAGPSPRLHGARLTPCVLCAWPFWFRCPARAACSAPCHAGRSQVAPQTPLSARPEGSASALSSA